MSQNPGELILVMPCLYVMISRLAEVFMLTDDGRNSLQLLDYWAVLRTIPSPSE